MDEHVKLATIEGKQGDSSPPRVTFSEDGMKAIAEPYVDSIVIIVLGKRVSYTTLVHRLKHIWCLKPPLAIRSRLTSQQKKPSKENSRGEDTGGGEKEDNGQARISAAHGTRLLFLRDRSRGIIENRAKAIDFEASTKLKLVFFTNCCQMLEAPLLTRFYENCFFPMMISALYELVREAWIFDVVKMIQDAKTKLPYEFGKYLTLVLVIVVSVNIGCV
ncbi:hypothetical protein PIB30_085583 [Stylosanthes scabra]|uniref:Uncharacterized protein n=1 Tax=Stylosanthes scabra TaxID=79078 RepID=A0ABU6QSF4_9FABA|nr:hypothetical protein [Stylosanthes scabra]